VFKTKYMFFRSYLKCFQKVDEIIQLARFNRCWNIKKNNKIYQEQSREREQERSRHKDLSWFIRPAPYSTVRISTIKRSNQINL